ncbi:hypothetical protein HPP92_001497 [Vanilla planifolia]|uniref:protein-serine/threonine phosphatase n=1 Tax=Vanilla planifolia TaxID=51239 RepID=A0A835RZE0_VANPL|nr:hypothetical protein HPP92_001497 [Vanilla planifolia]
MEVVTSSTMDEREIWWLGLAFIAARKKWFVISIKRRASEAMSGELAKQGRGTVGPNFWTDTESAIRKAYEVTDNNILEKAKQLGKGGSTAVTAILIDGWKLVVANVGDSRAVICKNGVAKQLSVDHEPNRERCYIEKKGGFVSNIPGDVPRVDGQLAVARAFGDRSLKVHLSSVPDVKVELVDDKTEFLILASDGLWKVMSNQQVVDAIREINDPQVAAKHLTQEALIRKSKDDISCIVIKFG